MTRKFVQILVLGFISVTLLGQTGHRSGTTAAQFLSFPMGTAYTVTGPIAYENSSLQNWHWNPSLLGELKGSTFSVNQADFFMDQFYSSASISGIFDGIGGVGVRLLVYNSGDLDLTTLEDPVGGGATFNYNASMVVLGYGRQINDVIMIGLSPKIMSESTYDLSATAVAMDLGFSLETKILSSRLLLGLRNLGGSMRLSGTILDQGSKTELSTRSWELPIERQVGLSVKVLGDTHAIFSSNITQLVFGLGLSDYADRPNIVTSSLEANIAQRFIFRYGYYFEHELIQHVAGAGVRFALPAQGISRVDIDYAFVPWGVFGHTNQFSLGVAW